ncbi:IclR family transcriptional regulator [Rhodococcus pseudokoreensis]|uniref:IclR family transcriptional regulator n=1 Tax=Rhodococcus pseudokoreensis TaxID=2811421 RepID=A0A974ZWR1_9NOCA|nr:IclR family transcriptional regulator [Rhodococcus pseudokoreensis]QSE92802.1 IclR family transcriptional regulator [Rhodococcus pseudokoreensis]
MTALEPTYGDAKEHRTVSRVTRILELAACNDRGVRLSEISAELDAPHSSVHALVKGLVANGYLRDDGGNYVIGPAVRALLGARPNLERAARAGMERLHTEFDETVTLVSLIGESVVYTDAIESTQPIRYSPTLRVRRPLYPTSAGKCFLAHMGERSRENYIAAHFADEAKRQQVRDELRAVTEQGGAINRAETLPDLYAVSAPIFDFGQVVAALTIAGPSSRFVGRLDGLLVATKDTAKMISAQLQQG